MKKRISMIVCAAMLLNCGAYAAEADFDRKSGKVTVSGKASENENISVIAFASDLSITSAEDIKNNAKLIYEITAGEDGTYSGELNFGDVGGNFNILLNGESVKETIKVSVYSQSEITEALEKLTAAATSGKSDVKALLENKTENIAGILGIDEIYKESPTEVIDEIALQKTFETLDDLETILVPIKERAECLKNINAMINKVQVKGLLEKAYTVLGSENSSYNSYMKLTNTDKVDQILFSAKPYSSLNDFMDKLKSAMSSGGTSSGGGSSSGGSSSSGKGSGGTVFAPGATTANSDIVQTSAVFGDVSVSHWAKNAIEFLAEKGVVSGDENNKFNPDNSIKREEFVKMLVCAIDGDVEDGTDSFIDTDKTAWYSKYLAKAKEIGIVSGRDDGSFGVGENLTRQDMAVMIMKAVQVKNMTISNGKNVVFADEQEISDYAKESVNILAAAGLVNGTGDNRFEPKAKTTRAQAAQIIYNLIVTEGGI